MDRVSIYLAYSHRDQKWRDRIVTFLQPLLRSGDIEVWDDTRIQTGENWSQEISTAISRADIAILLVTADFLASEFIQKQELNVLLAQGRDRGLMVVPVIVSPCLWEHTDAISRYQVLPRGGRPLSGTKDIDQALLEIAQQVANLAQVVVADRRPATAPQPVAPSSSLRSGPPKPSKPIPASSGLVFVSHDRSDGDFAELLKLTLAKSEVDAWIDLDRLRVGDDWRVEIDEAIRICLALIVVVTPEAKQSEYVTYEWAFAAGAGKKVIPLMVTPTQLHPRLEAIHYLDFTNRRARPWAKLVAELRHAKAEAEHKEEAGG